MELIKLLFINIYKWRAYEEEILRKCKPSDKLFKMYRICKPPCKYKIKSKRDFDKY